jgi:hypothetical protein
MPVTGLTSINVTAICNMTCDSSGWHACHRPEKTSMLQLWPDMPVTGLNKHHVTVWPDMPVTGLKNMSVSAMKNMPVTGLNNMPCHRPEKYACHRPEKYACNRPEKYACHRHDGARELPHSTHQTKLKSQDSEVQVAGTKRTGSCRDSIKCSKYSPHFPTNSVKHALLL